MRKSRCQLAYIKISINKKPYQGHRLAFLYMTGKFPHDLTDHIDGNGTNNKWNNLRLANRLQNLANRKINTNNTSGFKGVYFDKRDKRYYARIGFNGDLNLGRFSTPEEAHIAYCKAAKEYFGEYARFK